MRRRLSKVIAVTALVFTGAGMSEACRTATQVELVVTYDGKCTDLNEVAFIIGTDPKAAEGRIETNVFTTTTSHCEQGSPSRVGTLVVTPNDATGRASIIVLGAFGQHASDCKPEKGYAGCIIARRAFAFVDHTALTLQIPLEASCKNVPCDALSTCKHMACVNSNVACAEGGCGEPGVIGDGGTEFADAPTNPDAYVQGLDAQPPPMDGSIDSPIIDDAMVPPETGTDAGSCNGSDQFVSCTKTGPMLTICSGLGPVCCYGAGGSALAPVAFGPVSAGPEAGVPDAMVPMGYDCRTADMCMPQVGTEPNVNCRGAMNCHAGSVCCLDNGGSGTFCFAGSACPMEGSMTARVCGAGCECPVGKTCINPRSVGDAPAQSVLTCQ